MPLSNSCKELLKNITPFEISEEIMQSFERLYERTLFVNSAINITAIYNEVECIVKHIADSISVLSDERLKGDLCGGKWIDVGSGGGFPALPVKIMRPGLDITLLDSTKKKIDFLEETGKLFGFEKYNTLVGRAEEFANTALRERYDFVSARAVAELSVLSELCIPFLKKGGVFFAFKGKKAFEELELANSAINKLGAEVEEVTSVDFSERLKTDDDKLNELLSVKRYIIKIRKVQKTPSLYPRKYAAIVKKPL